MTKKQPTLSMNIIDPIQRMRELREKNADIYHKMGEVG